MNTLQLENEAWSLCKALNRLIDAEHNRSIPKIKKNLRRVYASAVRRYRRRLKQRFINSPFYRAKPVTYFLDQPGGFVPSFAQPSGVVGQNIEGKQ